MKIHCLQTGDVQIKYRHQLARYEARPARVVDILIDKEWSARLTIGCWLIEHPEGLILVDTGESSHANDPGYQPWWHPFMQRCERRWVKPEEEVNARIQSLGFNPRDVRWVIMTHMHGDHAGGIGHFPGSEIILSKKEAHDALAWNGPVQGFLNMHYPKWLKPTITTHDDGPFESFDRSMAVTKDGAVRIVPTPGHTLGHQSVVVDAGSHYIMIAGDASYRESYMLEGRIDGVAVDATLHHDSTRRMRELCKRKPTITQFAHDFDSAKRLEEKIFTLVSE
ncbi:MBL fold metallo-hydrolase (plasmid) [Pantoea agglomerans]|uniref:N-acyl homoserine lactonase family protein n=1 Tax=Enterobacter agglomerans TaxID=549 RepID=UPI0013BCB26F|nr:N-acyl homoserine lactonase family protein [Pantoea agglomerans]NEG87916.1 MBL fold metallo-hydrolase [Pantoea agglomerans]NEH10000.1 MBL fold metallo-hydrolase [Pantoea agglomerans]